MILAGGRGTRLSVLTEKRAKPAVPFAAKYRIIDFTLSNCVNSGIYDVGVLTQYRPYSLNDHVGRGNPWDLNRSRGGVTLLHPYLGREESNWYQGTADAIRQNLDFLDRHNPDLVLILAGDHVYRMDYALLAGFHVAKEADLTIGAIRVSTEAAKRMGVLAVDDESRVVDFLEKPENPPGTFASMGIYIFEPRVLIEELSRPPRGGEHDFGMHIIPQMIHRRAVYAYPFRGYWVDVGTVESYWQAHMDLLAEHPSMDLTDLNWIIHTRSEERSPARVARGAEITESLISHGCVIEGTVRRSVLSPGVRIERGAVVTDSIILTDAVVGRGAVLEMAILDKHVRVGPEVRIGGGEAVPNPLGPSWLGSGVTLVGKNTSLPAGLVVGRNCVISGDLGESHFETSEIASGETVGA